MTGTKKCANPACSCSAPETQKYCSAPCEGTGDSSAVLRYQRCLLRPCSQIFADRVCGLLHLLRWELRPESVTFPWKWPSCRS